MLTFLSKEIPIGLINRQNKLNYDAEVLKSRSREMRSVHPVAGPTVEFQFEVKLLKKAYAEHCDSIAKWIHDEVGEEPTLDSVKEAFDLIDTKTQY